MISARQTSEAGNFWSSEPQSAGQSPSSIAADRNWPASVTPRAADARMRDAIFTLIADVAGLPDALSTWAEAASSTDLIIETSSGSKSFGEILIMRTPVDAEIAPQRDPNTTLV
jgi:hypothetical protein